MPFFRHSACASASSSEASATAALVLNFPPGITIFPALRVRGAVLPTRAARGLGSPSAFRWRRVRRFSTGGSGGGGVAAGDGTDDSELTESAEEPDADKSGVSRSSASIVTTLLRAGAADSTSTALVEDDARLLTRFAAPWELSETCDDAEDSSNVRLGERHAWGSSPDTEGNVDACEEGAVEGGGEGEAEPGSGIWAGVRRPESPPSAGGTEDLMEACFFDGLADLVFAFDDAGFDTGFFETGDGGQDPSGAGASMTSGNPVCGPLRFLIEEKCSQSW